MKESKLIRLKNEVRLLTKTVKQLIEDFLKLDSITIPSRLALPSFS